METLTKIEITRLARRAGVTRLSKLSYEEIRGVLKLFVEEILSKASSFTQDHVTTAHVMMALPQGSYTDETQDVPCLYFKSKKRRGRRALEEIRMYQKSTCLLTDEKPWRQEIDNIIGEGIADRDVYHMIHVVGESHAIHMLQNAVLSTIHAKRTTLMPKDIALARRIQGTPVIMRAAKTLPKFDFRRSIDLVRINVHEDIDINGDALGQLNFLMNVLAENIAQRVAALIMVSQRTTITGDDVSMAMSGLLGEHMAEHARSNTNNVSFPADSALPFLRYCTNYVDMLGCSSVELDATASKAFAAVLEYVCVEILDLAGNVSDGEINARALELAINNDTELSALFRDLGIVIAGGGVIPNIHHRLIPLKREQGQEEQEA